MKILASLIVLSVSVLPLAAQWADRPTPGLPRTADGKPDLSAPAPRTPDGKPDLSGVWRIHKSYLLNAAPDLKPGDIQPWAAALYKQSGDNYRNDTDGINCLPPGPKASTSVGSPVKIIQTPNVVVLLYEYQTLFRQVFTDGRELPKDPNPTWMGYSIGRWEGDTLVVDTAGFNERSWLDIEGHPHTEALPITERFHRRDFGHMDLEMTIDDPKAFTRPFTLKIPKTLQPDTDLLESVCENDRSVPHMLGGVTVTKLAPEVLKKYVGIYEFTPGRE